MKKLLIALLCVLCARGAYSDGDEIEQAAVYIVTQNIAGRLGSFTAEAICNKMFRYADAKNIKIRPVQYGRRVCLGAGCCGDDDGNFVAYVTVEVARQIVSAEPTDVQKLPECAIKRMQEYAKSKCGGDTQDSIIKCSTTDRRCVVGRPNENGTFNVSCCIMPNIDCIEEGKRSEYNIQGATSLEWSGTLEQIPEIDNFGYDCNPISGDDYFKLGDRIDERSKSYKLNADVSCKERFVKEEFDVEFKDYMKDKAFMVGGTVDGDSVVKCSETSDRCVINVPILKQSGRKKTKRAFLSWCMTVPFFVADENCTSFKGKQNYMDTSVLYSDTEKTLNDFDLNCYEMVKH